MKYACSIFFIFITFGSVAHAATFFSDPYARIAGDGTEDRPWPSLEECIETGFLSQLQPGDTLFLKNGYHGVAMISGFNSDFITIAAAPSHENVRLSRLDLTNAAKWVIRDLRISPSFGDDKSTNYLVSFSSRSEKSGHIVIEGCEIFSVDDHAQLNGRDWLKARSGVYMGPYAANSVIRDCYIRNTRFGIFMSGEGGEAVGNIIENFSADAIRMTRDGQVAKYNVIKNAFGNKADGDSNHDDGIQCFLYNKGTGVVRNLTISHNIIVGQRHGMQKHATVNQGIGLFDGPLVGFKVDGNVIMVSHWHGLSIYDAQNCSITNNIVWSAFGDGPRPFIMLGSKLNQARDNTVIGNYAMSFRLGQPRTVSKKNRIVTNRIFHRGLNKLGEEICQKFGPYHRIAKRHRITGETH